MMPEGQSPWHRFKEKETTNMKKESGNVISKRILSFVMAVAILMSIMAAMPTKYVDAASRVSDGEYYFAAPHVKSFYKKKGYLNIKMKYTDINKIGDYSRRYNKSVMKVKLAKNCKFYVKNTGQTYKNNKGKRTTFNKIKRRIQYNIKMRNRDFSKVDDMGQKIVIKNGKVVEIIYTKGFVGAS